MAFLAASVIAPVPQLRVAAVFNLTGSMESVDRPGYLGMKMAAEELNRSGKLKVTLHVIDGRSNPKTAANALKNFLRRQKVDAVAGLYDSDYALSVGKVAQSNRIPFVATGATLPGLTTMLGSYCFTACYGDDDQARAMAKFARKILQTKTTSVLADPRWDYTKTIAKEFPKAFADLGGKWLLTINDPDPGRKEPVKFGSESIFAATLPEDAGSTVKRLRQGGFEGPIFSGDGFDTPLLAKTAGIYAFKVFFTTHVSYDSPDKAVRAFVKAYTARFKNAPESASAALGYDTMRLIGLAAIRKGRQSLRDSIAETKGFEGVTGEITYAPGEREPVKSVSVVEQLGKDRVYRGAF
jgi:branched-chain amino acid transport system substrate-binding protein